MAYTTLPGVRVTLEDGFYAATNALVDGNADRVLIVAKAGPSANASVLRNPSIIWTGESEVVNAFGRGSDVHKAFQAAVKGGARNIFISATDYAPAHAVIPALTFGNFTAVADATQDEYELFLALENVSLANPSVIIGYGYPATETVLDGDISGAVARVAYYAAMFAQKAEDLTLEVGPAFAVLSVDTFEDFYEKSVAVYSATVALGNTDGVETTFVDATSSRWIRNGVVPVVTVAGVANPGAYTINYDSASVTFAAAPATGHAVTIANVYTVATASAYSGTYPVVAADVATYVNWMVGATLPSAEPVKPFPISSVTASVEAITDPSVEDSGLSKYLVLTLGDVQITNQVNEIGMGESEYMPACASVAGNTYRLPLDEAITMKPLLNVTSIAFDMTPAQKIAIINKGAVPIGVSPSGLLVTVDGVTAAVPDDDGSPSVYNRLSTLRIVHEVIRGTRGQLEPFVGTTATTARLNSIETKLRSYFMALKQNELCKEIRFEMRYSISTSKLSVTITVMPFGEIRDIEVTVDVVLQ